MKFLNYTIITIVLMSLLSCSSNSAPTEETNEVVNVATPNIPFEGTWTRSFALGDDMANVYYRVSSDQIEYEMQGPMARKYAITKDTFLQEGNRWIGKFGDKQYVIFVKNQMGDSISLFKKSVDSFDAALSMEMPSDTARSRFTSWNVFYKK